MDPKSVLADGDLTQGEAHEPSVECARPNDTGVPDPEEAPVGTDNHEEWEFASQVGDSARERDRERLRRKREVRSQSISLERTGKKYILGKLKEETLLVPDVEGVVRPKTRGECVGGERPCPFVSCVHHLYLDVSPKTGSLKLNFPDLDVSEMTETCSLDVADRSSVRREEVASIMNLTPMRIQQILDGAFARIKKTPNSGLEVFGEGRAPRRLSRLPLEVDYKKGRVEADEDREERFYPSYDHRSVDEIFGDWCKPVSLEEPKAAASANQNAEDGKLDATPSEGEAVSASDAEAGPEAEGALEAVAAVGDAASGAIGATSGATEVSGAPSTLNAPTFEVEIVATELEDEAAAPFEAAALPEVEIVACDSTPESSETTMTSHADLEILEPSHDESRCFERVEGGPGCARAEPRHERSIETATQAG